MGDWVRGIGVGRHEDEGGEWASFGKKKRQNKRQSTTSRAVKTAAEATPGEKENPGSRHVDANIPQSQGSTVFKKKIFGDGTRVQRLVMSTAADKTPAEHLAHLRRFLSRYNRGEKGRSDVLKILVSLMKKSPPAHAIHLFNEVKKSKVQLNTITYNAAISACEKGGQTDQALRLLDEMKRDGIERDTITYSAAISACEKGGQTDQALRLLDEMKRDGIERNTITYSAAISACEKGGQTDQALRLLQGAISDGIFKADPVRQGLLDLHCKAVLTEDAYACFLTSRPEALAHDPGVPLPVAKTMLQRHIDMLTPGAVIVVGCHGDDILRDGVMEFLFAHGIKAQPDKERAGCIVVIQETPPLV